MSLSNIIPLLNQTSAQIREVSAWIQELENKPELKADYPELTIGQSNQLNDLASQLEGQVRTAGRRFTIAVVGEFKVGKSTFLNSLLRLSGDASLSSGDNPDTACSILLRYRDEGCPEARLNFNDGSSQDVPWSRARELTSQIHLDVTPTDKPLAGRLLEVEYFLDNPVLAQVNLNDLPGTGSRFWKEHTEQTHKRMIEADSVIWIVGENEPSASAKQDLAKLADCAQQVIPIINVLEDLEAKPPIPRDQKVVDEMEQYLLREYRSFFAEGFGRPLQVSSKVAGIELCKTSPDKTVLAETGWEAVERILETAFRKTLNSGDRIRLNRVSNATVDIMDRAEMSFTAALKRVEEVLPKMYARDQSTSLQLDDLESVRDNVRARVRTLSRSRSSEICTQVAAQARNFIEDTLQITNLPGITASISKGGRTKFDEELKSRFMNNYLGLAMEPNWLTELQKSYANDVQSTVMPLWRQLLARLPEPASTGKVEVTVIDVSQLGSKLQQGVLKVIGILMGIATIATILAIVPGGQIIDAIGILGFTFVSVLTDPLEDLRRRAADSAIRQVNLQQYAIQNNLFDAAMNGSEAVESAVRAHLSLGKDRATKNLQLLIDAKAILRRGRDHLSNAQAAISQIGGIPE